MDLSKLPRLSQTSEAQPDSPAPIPPTIGNAQPAPATPVAYRERRTVLPVQTSAAEAWFSVAIGGLVLLVYPRFLQWVATRSNPDQFSWTFDDGAGKALPYSQTAFFLPDLALTVFGIVLILEGILLFANKRNGIWTAFVLTALATLLNLIAVVYAYRPIGLQILSALAVAIGVYMCLVHWRILHADMAGE